MGGLGSKRRRQFEPLETDDLIDRAYGAALEQHRTERPREPLPESCPPQARMLLRAVDYIARQRVMEHVEREPHTSWTKGRRQSKARAALKKKMREEGIDC